MRSAPELARPNKDQKKNKHVLLSNDNLIVTIFFLRAGRCHSVSGCYNVVGVVTALDGRSRSMTLVNESLKAMNSRNAVSECCPN